MKLLVSVRSAIEAAMALEAGADWVDVKEPSRGSLGRPSASVVHEIADVVDGRAPLSAAAGELVEYVDAHGRPRRSAGDDEVAALDARVQFVKLGLSGCRARRDWPGQWQQAAQRIAPSAQHVPVVYADGHDCGAPEWQAVVQWAAASASPAVLVDTFDKRGGTLLDHWSPQQLASFVREAHRRGQLAVVAGSLTAESLAAVAAARPDIVAVRGAACAAGRNGPVSAFRVRQLKELMRHHSTELDRVDAAPSGG